MKKPLCHVEFKKQKPETDEEYIRRKKEGAKQLKKINKILRR